MNVFEYIKRKYSLETNLKGIEYINSLENEVEELKSKLEEREDYTQFVVEENHLLYGRLNNIVALAEQKIS